MSETRRTRQVSAKDIAEIAIGLAGLPENSGKSLKELANLADRFLDHCAALAYKREISRADFVALKVEDTIYTHLTSPIQRAYANGDDFVTHEEAAKALTDLRTTKEAIARLNEFLPIIPSLGLTGIPISQDDLGNWMLGIHERGIPRLMLDALRPHYVQWWQERKSESAKERGHKSQKSRS